MENQGTEKLKNQEDVNPGTELDKIVDTKEELPETNGTGANRPVETSGTVVIRDDAAED